MKKIYDQAISSLLYLMFRPKNQADDGKSQWSLITTLGFTLYSSIYFFGKSITAVPMKTQIYE